MSQARPGPLLQPLVRCRDCGHETRSPSFSEGPKVYDEDLGQVVRFRQARSLCPECLSSNLELADPDEPARSPRRH